MNLGTAWSSSLWQKGSSVMWWLGCLASTSSTRSWRWTRRGGAEINYHGVHCLHQVCPWGTWLQDRSLWGGARKEERWRRQRPRGGGGDGLLCYSPLNPPFPPGAHTGIPEAPVEPDSWCQESKQARREEALGFLNRPRRPINEPDIIWYPLASMTRCQNCQVSKNILSPCCPVSCHCQGHGLFGAIHAIL